MPTVNEVRRRMVGLGPAAPAQFAGPVQRGFQGTAQPVPATNPVSRRQAMASQQVDPRNPRQPVFAPQVPQQGGNQQQFANAQQRAAAMMQQGFNQDIDMAALSQQPQREPRFAAQQQFSRMNDNVRRLYEQFGGQRPPATRPSPFLSLAQEHETQKRKQPTTGPVGGTIPTRPPVGEIQPEGYAPFATRPPLFGGNFTTPFDQQKAALQGFQSQMPRQRPFAAFYAGQRQGRGGRQPVASQQDATFRQRLQESSANQNRFANTAGNIRGRTLQRRPVFA